MRRPGALNPICEDSEMAREYLEEIRWPNAPICPNCESSNNTARLGGSSKGAAWYWCKQCRRQFTVTIGSAFERTHIPLNKWIHALDLIVKRRKDLSVRQLQRILHVSYRSAFYLNRHINLALKEIEETGLRNI